ncbi:helix-turn-helix domain-containing protein [Sphingobacterium sp. lm-10]|uniref:helix-turn-helix domain-containing protein n=1 Tax=Sphingobacterium sp. lm-10 TaxID=2944904 RepID=UPI00202078F9|nr:helix-turn-helix transcriptional regulator [Sphingobacterium sp. lm-10]MCL7987768.1 helix-turn-helix domain-containing protein [Sphingobacterium sp. lm-10]MCL8000807.1 helix-turn-helix domain-containing protein [Brucella sp. 21LCYQ03]
MSTDFTEVGKLIASFRHDQGWTAEELKSKLGISTVTLSRIENGKQGPNAGVIKKLSELGMDVADLTYASRFHSKEQSLSYRLAEVENKLALVEQQLSKVMKALDQKS